jgi:hypothetical protein
MVVPGVQRRGPVRRIAAGARRWFRAFRRTRPFWGGLWLALGGYVVIHLNATPLGLAIGGGWNRSGGYILGGAMVMFGLVAWFSPLYARMVGLFGVLAALAAFVSSNLGGLLVGSVLGILGGSMIWGWGERKPRTRRDRRTGTST